MTRNVFFKIALRQHKQADNQKTVKKVNYIKVETEITNKAKRTDPPRGCKLPESIQQNIFRQIPLSS